jgi:GntR family transcriptional regulator, carbon starvation induced regulator
MTAPAKTIATAVYRTIREDVLRGALAPGAKLRVDELCARYEASGSPVREALNRLASEGLVERNDQRGFFVARATIEELRELVKTRCWVEALALRESIANATQEWEEGIVLAAHRLARTRRSLGDDRYLVNPEWETLHAAYHHALIANCGSRVLLDFCADLRDRADRYRQLAAASSYPKRNEGTEHAAIQAAVLGRETDKAIELLNRHYRRTLELVEASGLELGGAPGHAA